MTSGVVGSTIRASSSQLPKGSKESRGNPEMSSAKTVKSTEYRDSVGVALRVTIVSLALASAYIHFTLGSLLFLANAAGYTVLAVAMVLPGAFMVRNRWIVRAALAGFTSVTIIGWAMIGPRFML